MLHEKKIQEWYDNIYNYPKLRTYDFFKNSFGHEPYVTINMNRNYGCALARLRSGILPLDIKVGRWNNVNINARLCKLCNNGSIENEYHFMFECQFYDQEIARFVHMLDILNGDEKMKWGIFILANNVNEKA